MTLEPLRITIKILIGGIVILRIISGSAKGMKIVTLEGENTRPTSDRTRESLFNIINPMIIESRVLDVFSGSGAISLEALSRGAASAVAIDKDKQAAKIIKTNIEKTGFSDKCRLMTLDFKQALIMLSNEKCLFDIIYIDPPYNRGLAVDSAKLISKLGLLANGGILICEHDSKENMPTSIHNLVLFDRRKYGKATLTFYKLNELNGELSEFKEL